MPPIDPSLLAAIRGDASAARAAAAGNADDIARLTSDITNLNARAAALDSQGDRQAAAALRNDARLLADRRDAVRANAGDAAARVRDVLDRFRDRIDPCDADPAIPLVLFPVRLETRFTADGRSLRVRIFPDDIHLDSLDRGLSDDERAAGMAYWAAARTPETRDAAWAELVSAVGASRSLYVAVALTPTNTDAWGNGAAPQFPDTPVPSRRATVSRLLPDRFVAIAEQDGGKATAVGAVVPPEVITGLLSDDGTPWVDVKGVKVPQGAEWICDYDRAVQIGLGITVPLQQPGAAVKRLYVVGVRGSMGPDESSEEVASVLLAHRCTRGLAFVPQGTPSNNTESDRTDWQGRPTFSAPGHVNGAAPVAGTNAGVLASALGIPPDALDGVDNGDKLEQPNARAINAALWGPTWDTLLDRLSEADDSGPKDVVSDATREAVRTFFRDSVRARGPLPAIRVGDQPYGVLPVSSLDDQQWRPSGDAIEQKLLPLLRKIRFWWNAAGKSVPQLGSGPLDDVLLDILGSAPVCQGLRVRSVISDDTAKAASSAGIVDIALMVNEATLAAITFGSVGLDVTRLHSLGSLESKGRPLPFPMVHETDPDFMDALIKGAPTTVRSILQAMLAIAWDRAQRGVNAAALPGKIRDVLTLAKDVPSPLRDRTALMSDRVESFSAAELNKHADEVAAAVGESGAGVVQKFSPIESFSKPLADLAKESKLDASRASLANAAVGVWSRAAARQAEVREAIQLLMKTTLDERRVLFAELLDLASHRLDAFLTGIIERRRASLRAATPSGLTIGAYGFVENISPGARTAPDGGYIHAPSLAHAATAGILRSAYLTHQGTPGAGSFAVDLSSSRVRTGLHLTGAMREGQPLGAVLGYRIERALHEARLDRLTLTLRGIAPLVAAKLTDRKDAVPAPSQEAIAAANVLDGVRLVERFKESPAALQEIRQALNDPPKNNEYVADTWPALTQQEWDRVQKIVSDADKDLDATADLLLAESVHQIVQGNTARSAAALNAAANGDSTPPEPDVIRTPSPSIPFTHRIILLAPAQQASWNPGRPRAAAEPALESWAAGRLGSPGDIVVGVLPGNQRLTLAQTGLCALDIIYESADPRRVEQRLRAALPQLSIDTPLATRRDPAWPAGQRAIGEIIVLAASLRAVLAGSRPARPTDFARPGETAGPDDPPPRRITPAALDAVKARAVLARSTLAVRTQTLADALAPPDNAAIDPVQVAIALEDLAAFGVVLPLVSGESLLALAEMGVADARRRIAKADEALAAPVFDAGTAEVVSQAIFGDGFWMLAEIEPPAQTDLFCVSLTEDPIELPKSQLRGFLRDIGSVREPVSRFSESLLLGDALARPAQLRVAQLCSQPAPWVGGPIDPAVLPPQEPITSIVLDAPPDYDPFGMTVGLVVDQWSDAIPSRVKAGEADDAPIDDRRASGLAINANAASSRAPQAILLAIAPSPDRWTVDRLVGTLAHTIDLMHIRPVTLERSLLAGRVLPALYTKSRSLQGEKVFDFRAVKTMVEIKAALAFVKETP